VVPLSSEPGPASAGPSGAAPRLPEERHGRLLARAILVSGLTLLSRLLGFVREGLMAAVFGDRSVISDAFITAWRFPNLFRRLLGEGALSVSLQSGMTKLDLERGDAAGRALFRSTLRLMTGILAAVTVVAIAVTLQLPDEAPLVGGAWLGPMPAAVRDLTVRVMPYVVLVCVAALCGGALAVRGHFALPSLAPTAMNLVWIGALVAIGIASGWGTELGRTPAEVTANQWRLARWLGWGLLGGGAVQLLLHLVPLRRHGLVGPTPGEASDPWPVFRATLPLVIGAAIYQINVMVDGLMANGLLRAGGSSVIYYANRVQQFPLALVSTAAVNAVFPLLNAHGHLGERARLRSLHDRTQLGILYLALPSAAGLFALALPIASVCYERGNFGLDGTERVAVALRCLAFALVPAGAAALTSRVFVAMDDLRTPVRIALAMVALNVALNVGCVVGLGLDAAGLTLATAITSWINLAWLLVGLRTRLGLPAGDRELLGRVARMALASVLAAAAAFGAHHAAASLIEASVPRHSLFALLVGLASAGATYGVFSHLLRIPEWGEAFRRLRGRLEAGQGPKR
jgi:putative peptidoglycan lipid II flippase